MSAYSEALTEAMTWLGQEPRTVFLGQAVAYPGTAMTGTLAGVAADKKIEMPVAEEMQMGATLGLAIAGQIPVSIYPRWNFLILAANQLVNHIDKISMISTYKPTILIRVGIGSRVPLDPGPQHDSDFTEGFRAMLQNVPVVKLTTAEEVRAGYRDAVARGGATVLVEVSDLYQ